MRHRGSIALSAAGSLLLALAIAPASLPAQEAQPATDSPAMQGAMPGPSMMTSPGIIIPSMNAANGEEMGS
jgi:hypothetical protein